MTMQPSKLSHSHRLLYLCTSISPKQGTHDDMTTNESPGTILLPDS